MTLPSPHARTNDGDEDRALFLEACAHVWDHGRQAGRAQMTHGARMILGKMGGTLLLRAESTMVRRSVPEAGFISEGCLYVTGMGEPRIM